MGLSRQRAYRGAVNKCVNIRIFLGAQQKKTGEKILALTPISPNKVREWIAKHIGDYHLIEMQDASLVSDFAVNQGQRGAIIGALNRYCGGDKYRHKVLAFLFDPAREEMSTDDLSAAQWYALSKWVEFAKIEGQWTVTQKFIVECAFILTRIMRDSPKESAAIEQAVHVGGLITATYDGENEEDAVVAGQILREQDKIPGELIPKRDETLAEKAAKRARVNTTFI